MSILTETEAAQTLRTSETDEVMLGLLPIVDQYIQNATGRDWGSDLVVDNTAKAAARMLLTMWYENPAMIGSGMGELPHGLTAVLAQLEAKAL